MLETKTIKYFLSSLVIYISASSTSYAETAFIDFFQTDPLIDKTIANRITSYYVENISLPIEKQKTELLWLQSELEKLSKTHSEQATYWFLKGLNQRNLASYYFEKGKPEIADRHIRNKDSAYARAIELDKESTDNLSATIYSTMKYGLPQKLKIKATQKELSLGGSGDSESSYWYLHWSNIDQLKKAGRDKEASKAYKNMLNEMKEDNTDMSVYNDLNQTIEKITLQKPITIQEKPNIKVPKKPESSTKKETYKPKDKKLIIISSIVIVSLISLVILTIYEFKIKKRRKKQHND